jgi:tetratricopeptide (TPR) repeat protein
MDTLARPTAATSSTATSPQRTALVCAALALVTALAYWPVATCDFVNFDDSAYIVGNFHITHGISLQALRWCFQAGYVSNWHPLTWMSHLVDCQLYGLRPAGHHLTNLFLHVANSALLFLVLKSLTRTFWRSAMVAALFALHPMHVESVAWVSERKDVLSGLFWILAMGAYSKYAARGGAGRYALVLGLFALGLMAKPMLVTFPFVLLLLDWWPLGRFKAGRGGRTVDATAANEKSLGFLVVEKIPFFALSVASSIITLVAQARGQAVVSLANAPLKIRLASAAVSYARYIDKLIWPTKLTAIHPFETAFSTGELAFSAVIIVGMTAAAISAFRTRRWLGVGWFWFLGTLVPVIGLVQVGGQSWADRYTYLPSIGFFIMLCWGLEEFTRHLQSQRAAMAAGAAVVLAACAVLTFQQIGYWKNGGTLFLRAIQVSPDNFIAHCNYGAYLRDQNRLAEAEEECRKGLKISPNYVYGHLYLASVLVREGKTNDATAQLQQSLEIMPEQPGTWADLGRIHLDEGAPAAAAAAFGQALRFAPQVPGFHVLLGHALAVQGKFTPAEAEFAQALRLAPRFADAEYELALALEMQGRIPDALTHYKAAISDAPDFPDALNNCAWILATSPVAAQRNGAKAVEMAARACALTQNTRPMTLGTLAAAYAEAGRFDEAVSTAQKAHDVALAQGNRTIAERNLQLLQRYRSHQPWREASGK